jgi:hypothetical protein
METLIAKLNFAVSAFKRAFPVEQIVAQPAVSRMVADDEPTYLTRAAATFSSRCRLAPLVVCGGVSIGNARRRTAIFVMAGPFPFPVQG